MILFGKKNKIKKQAKISKKINARYQQLVSDRKVAEKRVGEANSALAKVTSDDIKAKIDSALTKRQKEFGLADKALTVFVQKHPELNKRLASDDPKKAANKSAYLKDDFLELIKPLGNLQFYSDYFVTGSHVACILTFLSQPGTALHLPAMWGINLIPSINDEGVTAILFNSYNVRDDKWVQDHLNVATEISAEGAETTAEAHQVLQSKRSLSQHGDVQEAADEIAKGASYLDFSVRLLLKAPTKEILDKVVMQLQRTTKSRFSGANVEWVKFVGQQQDDYSAITLGADQQLGENYQMTSSELAGSYSMMTRGLEDPKGSYIGQLAEDINSGAVLWDAQNFRKLLIIGAENKLKTVSHPQGYDWNAASAWSQYIAQDAILNGKKVIHVVLDNQDVERIGTSFGDKTEVVPLNQPQLNPLEAFGDVKDELSLYTQTIEKINMMYKQLNPDLVQDDLAYLSKILNEFYIGSKLWVDNAKDHRDKLRLVGIPHDQVPTLSEFSLYLQNKVSFERRGAGNTVDEVAIRSLRRLSTITDKMIEDYGAVFDVKTQLSDLDLRSRDQVIFKMGDLSISDPKALMAQLTNLLPYIRQMIDGDTVVIFHGLETIDIDHNGALWEFFLRQLRSYWNVEAKVVLAYSDLRALTQKTNHILENADTILVGQMNMTELRNYEAHMVLELPDTIKSSLQDKDDTKYYLSTNGRNIVFSADLVL